MDTKYKDARAKLVRMWKKTGYIRKIIGPKAYSQTNILEWVKSELEGGHFIEAYALTDQYIETLVKRLFDDGTREYWKKKIPIEILFRWNLSSCKIRKAFLDNYIDFKMIRNDLVHNAIFNNNKYKRLIDTKKIKELPFKIISDTELFFEGGMKEYFKNWKQWFNKPEKSTIVRKKIDHLIDFKMMFFRQREEMSQEEAIKATSKYLSKNIIKE